MLIDRVLPTFDVTQICETEWTLSPDETSGRSSRWISSIP